MLTLGGTVVAVGMGVDVPTLATGSGINRSATNPPMYKGTVNNATVMRNRCNRCLRPVSAGFAMSSTDPREAAGATQRFSGHRAHNSIAQVERQFGMCWQ